MTHVEKLYGVKACYNFKNFYYFDDMLTQHGYSPDIPEHLHMMQHVYRSSISTGLRIKF